ncbi:MAG: ATP-binding protein [Proteobacteria bacterium]|nr:ATP-binding protein [Pseudomonadota bacterium]MBU2227181.1 ATP-binding protein [Pseudomonadota bacterium]
MDMNEMIRLVQGGESEAVEFKKSTGQLRRAGETLCGMLNGKGGRVLIGITPEGRILGQDVSDKTQRELADVIAKFEPPAQIDVEKVGNH